ncbi:MAG TPA: dihydroneopterin aldolase [Gammaproteobacteria bacterium]|nr:dihydroneopterin aldolase [Gammaproteobacteria bacterium]
MDIIYLHDLKVDCIIGIWEWERRTTQKLTIHLDMAVDIQRAAASDSIKDTLDYKGVAKAVIGFVSASQFQLVETLTEKIAELIVTEFKVPWVRVKLNKKGAIRGASDVGVILERGTRPSGLPVG